MSLKAAVEASRQGAGGRCSFIELYAKLSKKDAADLREMLTDEIAYTSSQITRGLAAEGHRVARGVIARHRRLECQCGAV